MEYKHLVSEDFTEQRTDPNENKMNLKQNMFRFNETLSLLNQIPSTITEDEILFHLQEFHNLFVKLNQEDVDLKSYNYSFFSHFIRDFPGLIAREALTICSELAIYSEDLLRSLFSDNLLLNFLDDLWDFSGDKKILKNLIILFNIV